MIKVNDFMMFFKVNTIFIVKFIVLLLGSKWFETLKQI